MAESFVHRVRGAVVVAHLAVLALRGESPGVSDEGTDLVVGAPELRALRLDELVLPAPEAPVAEVHLGAGCGRREVAQRLRGDGADGGGRRDGGLIGADDLRGNQQRR